MAAQQRILVVVDPTALAYPALERAAWLARAVPSALELFICDYDSSLADTRNADARGTRISQHKARLTQLAQPLIAAGIDVSVDARWDPPLHDGIVRKALELGADLVIKETHFHSVLKRSIFSNTDWNLIRSCASPLWLVKPRLPGKNPRFIAAVDPLHARDKPADLDNKILRMANGLARALAGEVHVFHGFDIAPALAGSSDSMAMPTAPPVRELTNAMRVEHTDAVLELCARHGIQADRIHVHEGGTRDLLVMLTDELNADVVIMGAVSRSGLNGLFLGNTAEDVLDRLPCDLLIVKPAEFKATLPS
ncbi:MAG: universal stress protein [Gammaproteobacteria bacterium]